jgi:thymidylate kinase
MPAATAASVCNQRHPSWLLWTLPTALRRYLAELTVLRSGSCPLSEPPLAIPYLGEAPSDTVRLGMALTSDRMNAGTTMNLTRRISAPPWSGRSAVWVSVDGVECAGKTSVCKRLAAEIQGCLLLQEFSSSPVGQYLRRSVESSPHVISRSLVGQSLLFLSDYAEVAQSAITLNDPDIKIILQDRGFLSKFVYQFIILQKDMGELRAMKLLSAITDELPRPDVTVFLDAPTSVIESRLRQARPNWLTLERQSFVEQAVSVYRSEIDTLEGVIFHLLQDPLDSIETVATAIVSELGQLLPQSDARMSGSDIS